VLIWLGLYLVGVVVVAVKLRRPLIALFWPAAAIFFAFVLVVIGIDLASSRSQTTAE
jgi:hypothetical protein